MPAGGVGVYICWVAGWFAPFCLNGVAFQFIASFLSGMAALLCCRVCPVLHADMVLIGVIRYEQLLEHYAYNNELGGTFSTMRTTAMGQARHIRECGFTYDVGQTMAGSVTISVPVFNHAGETNFFQSIGMAGKAIFLSLSRQLLFLMPGLIFLPRIFDELTPWDGSWGVWCSMPLSDFLASLVAGVMLFCQFRKFKAKAAAGRGEVSGAEVENDRRVNE